jgi:DNA-binding GntR family transcriptional regulator
MEESLGRAGGPGAPATVVAEQIRDLIIMDSLALAQPLSEQALAERLGVGTASVREAFVRLAAERLIEVRPQHGAFVFSGDPRELREAYEMRGILETGALRLAMQHGAARLLEELERNLGAADRADLRDPAHYQPFDDEFHAIIVEASGNRELIASYRLISGRMRALRHRLLRTREQAASSMAAHHEITDAVAAGDIAAAEAALGQHIFGSYRALLHLLTDGAGDDASRG